MGSNYGPAIWQPANEATVRLSPLDAPAAAVPETPAGTARLQDPTPISPEPPLAGVEEKRTTEAAKPAIPESSPTPPLPVGIPQFAYGADKVSSGLKPLLDGLDWLQANGYKTVLHVKQPGEEDAADRRLIEKHGMKYVVLEVSAQTLNRAAVDEFNRLVANTADQPLFVYDRDGTLAGGLWYLYFRTAGQKTDAEARSKAANLGLKTDADGDARTVWLAIQKFLSQQ